MSVIVSYVLVVALLVGHSLPVSEAQASDDPNFLPHWTWLGGFNSKNNPGIYGVKGIPSSDNQPGARYGAAGWFDVSRKEFWLFGGFGRDGIHTNSAPCTSVQLIHV